LSRHYASGKGLTAWVPSIMSAMTYGIGKYRLRPIASALTNKYGCRAITIAGSLLASFGLLVSVFAPNVITLFFTIGLCAGAGFGLIYLPAIVCVTCYFEKKRAFATGIAVCGSGIGSAIFALLTEWLIVVYGWKGAMLIVSAILLNCCFFGALFRPLISSGGQQEEEEEINERLNDKTRKFDEDLTDIDNNCELNYFFLDEKYKSPSRHSFCAFNNSDSKQTNLQIQTKLLTNVQNVALTGSIVGVDSHQTNKAGGTCSSKHHSHSRLSGIFYRKDIFYSASLINLPQYRSNPVLYSASISTADKYESSESSDETDGIKHYFKCSKEVRDTVSEMLNFALLKDPVFLLFTISNLFTSFGYYVPHIYVKDRTVGLEIASDEEGSVLLAIIGASSTIGRIVFGFLSDLKCINRLWLYNTCLTVCGLATMFSSFAKTYFSTALYCAVFGLTCGAYVSLTTVILVDLLGLEKLTNAFGLLLLFQGVASLIGPPVVGWMYDLTDSYDPGFGLAGAMIAISGLMLFFTPYLSPKQPKKWDEKSPVVVVNCE
ncbi:monocarboxylate transporter 9-like protein, partial [Dinothrombium tinctorium]